MKITLKNVNYTAFASQETACFNATVYVDGVAVCFAENDGHGGADMYTPVKGKTHADIHAVDESLKAEAVRPESMEDWQSKMCDEGHRPGLEIAVCAALDDYLLERDFKRALSRKIIFKCGDSIFEIKQKFTPAITTKVKERHPDAIILNAEPYDHAFMLWRAASNTPERP